MNMRIEKFNLFNLENITSDKDSEDVKILAKFKNSRVERIVSTGQTSDWYNQNEDEFVALIQGCSELIFRDSSGKEEAVFLEAGDSIMIPANTEHRVSYTSEDEECIWLCFFTE